MTESIHSIDHYLPKVRQLRGLSTRAIGAKLGISRQQAERLLKKLQLEDARLAQSTALAVIPPSALPALSRYDTARRALAEAKTFDEVMNIADQASAIKEYARRAKDRQLEIDAAEIRIRAERRLGEMLAQIKATTGLAKGGTPYRDTFTGPDLKPVERAPTLDEIGIDKNLSSRAQKLASISDRAIEARIAGWRGKAERDAGRVTADILREDGIAQRRAEHAGRTFAGGTVDDLRNLSASGFKAQAILADPPWHFVARSEQGESRSASQHYTTDRLGEITSLPVAELAAPDCVLFMWMVDWCPRLALEVIEAWGFIHKTTAFTWAKQNESGDGWHLGQGYWTRANPETCWLATRGSPRRLYADVRQLIVAPVMEHSRKPDEIQERIERLVPGPYLELYARRERAGWQTWGNELVFRAEAAE